MLRPHTFEQLGPRSFTLVLESGRLEPLNSYTAFQTAHDPRRRTNPILGFYISFISKTMTEAKAYYPRLSSPAWTNMVMCPVAALLTLYEKQAITNGFLATLGRGASLEKYLQRLTENTTAVSPYALRIGGRTWYLSQGLDRQFVDYLGTWASPEASARYFRAQPSTVLKMLRRFYLQVDVRGMM